MPPRRDDRYDFFLSRRGSVAAIAREVADVLTEKGYKVLVQDYDIPLGASFIDAMHEAIKNSRDLVILFTRDYEDSPYTRKEFTSFEAERAQSAEERHIIILRCENVPLRGLLADTVYQDLVGIENPDERKRRIIAAVERQSQVPPPPPRPFVGVPPRIAGFTGRGDELDRLDAILVRDKPAAVTQAVGRAAVQGMGGVGKSSLAVEYAYRFRGLYAGVQWCPAETRAALLTSLAALAVRLGTAARDEADVELAGKAALHRLSEQRATWLLIYDNVTSPDEINDLLPSAGARVLITSRFADFGGLAEEVTLDVLPQEEAVAFLQSRAGRSDAQGAKILAEALGRLPLALDHAAAYCKRSQMLFADYAAKASSLVNAAPRGVDYPRSVAASFDLAIAEAVAQCPAAEELMALLAHCAPERVPMIFLWAVADETKHLQALMALTEVSLVRHDSFEDGTPAISVHRLVQVVARVRAESNGAGQRAAERLIQGLVLMYPRDGFENPQSWPLCAKLTPHLLALRKGAPQSTSKLTNWPDLLNRAGGYFHGRASYAEAANIFRDALAICEKIRGPDHLDTAGCLNDLALLLKAQGDFEGARLLYKRALAIREKVLGLRHPETAVSLNNLALLRQAQGDYAEAKRLVRRALAICEKRLGHEHPRTAESLNNLATLLKREGDFVRARRLYERALAIREKALGPEHLTTAQTLNSLALLLHELDDLDQARPLLERAVAIHEKTLGPEHPITATSLSNLASLFQDQNDLARARPLLERALAIREKVLDPGDRRTVLSVNNLAFLLRDMGDLAKARLLLERALTIREKTLGPKHPDTAASLNNLANILRQQGDLEGARPLYERALAIRNKSFGSQHPVTATSLNNFALLLQDQGELSRARTLFEHALAIREKVLGKHPDTAMTLSNLARLYQHQGDFVGAQPLCESALAIFENVLGAEDPNTNRTRSNLARLLLSNNRPTEAYKLSEAALAAHDQILGRDHSWTSDSARVTADALDALGRTEEAAALRERYEIAGPEEPKQP